MFIFLHFPTMKQAQNRMMLHVSCVSLSRSIFECCCLLVCLFVPLYWRYVCMFCINQVRNALTLFENVVLFSEIIHSMIALRLRILWHIYSFGEAQV